MNKFGIAGLAAAASLSVLTMAAPAFAGGANTFTLLSSSMDTSYTALVQAPAVPGFGAIDEYVYDGPLTFTVSGYPGTTGVTTLFGFCFDLYHDMNLGNLGWTYTTNQPSGGGLDPNLPQTLNTNQTDEITDLVDTGWIMEMEATPPANLDAQEAAIQAAIWNVEVPGSVTNFNSALVASYYNTYANGPIASWNLATPQDKVFTISNGANQSFAIGWPIGVPEPATWAMMITGFAGVGSLLRRQRKAAVAA